MEQLLKNEYLCDKILDYLPFSDVASLSACNRFTVETVGSAIGAAYRRRILRTGISSYEAAYNLLDYYVDSKVININQIKYLVTSTGKWEMSKHELGKLYVFILGKIHSLGQMNHEMDDEHLADYRIIHQRQTAINRVGGGDIFHEFEEDSQYADFDEFDESIMGNMFDYDDLQFMESEQYISHVFGDYEYYGDYEFEDEEDEGEEDDDDEVVDPGSDRYPLFCLRQTFMNERRFRDPQIMVMKILRDMINDTCRLSEEVLELANDSSQYETLYESFCDYIQNESGLTLSIPDMEKLFIEIRNVFDFSYHEKYEDLNHLERMLNEGACLNLKIFGEPHLVAACRRGSYEVVKAMLDAGAYIDCRNRDGYTPLAAAITQNRKDIVELLISRSANINIGIPRFGSLLHFLLSYHSNFEIFELLVNSGIDLEILNSRGQTVLHVAIQLGLPKYADALLLAGAKLESKTPKGYTPLLLACKYGQEHIISALLGHGANIEAQDENGNTALMIASKSELLQLVKLLIENGANVNQKNNDGQTALHTAAHDHWLGIVELLIKHGADIVAKSNNGDTALIEMCKRENYIGVKALVEAGADVNTTDQQGKSTLFHSRNRHDICDILLEHGVELFNCGSNGETFLHELCKIYGNDHYISKFITKYPHIINAKDINGNTPIQTGITSGRFNFDFLNILIVGGANVLERNNDGKMAIELLMEQKSNMDREDAAKTLILAEWTEGQRIYMEYPADFGLVNCSAPTLNWLISMKLTEMAQWLINWSDDSVFDNDRYDITPVHWAAFRNETDLLQLLIEKSANADDKNFIGQTPLHFACMLGCVNAVNLLIENGARVDSKDRYGRTCLHYACTENNFNATLLKNLKDYGADLNSQDINGWTPLHYAIHYRKREFQARLIKIGADEQIRNREGKRPNDLLIR